MKKLYKSATMTDIHFGAKLNSEQHNQDCLEFIDWFCKNVKKDPSIDHVNFLGDWHENRNALNISTLNYSYRGAEKLNKLGIPVYFIIGNHDLYHRHNRDMYSVIPFREFKNFTVINEPVLMKNIGDDVLYSPYLFADEYPQLIKYKNVKTWWGHFEFKGFYITGYNVKMESGPDPQEFSGPSHIFSGHFHKRQANENIVYVGNCFPFTFGDAGDNQRGMMIYDHKKDTCDFLDWPNCPKYVKTTLSEILQPNAKLPKGSRVSVDLDIPISFEESNFLRKTFIEKNELREFSMEENSSIKHVMEETTTDIDWEENKLTSVDDLVLHMLKDIDSDHIDNKKLINIYTDLKPEQIEGK